MEDTGGYRETIFGFWTKNLVESPSSFALNILVLLTAGGLYSFGVFPSGYILFLFGVVSPAIFTICLYDSLRSSGGKIMGEAIPRVLSNGLWSRVLVVFDCCLIILFAALIHWGVLNFFVFRFLQTVLFPILLLVMLRGVYLLQHQRR